MFIIKNILLLITDSLLTLVSFFIKLDDDIVIITSTNNDNFNFNSKYFFLYIKEKYNDKKIFFIINDEEKRKRLNTTIGNHFINNKNIKNKYICLKAQYWISSTFELPLISIFSNKKRTIIHLGHGIPLKRIGLMEKDISKLQYINRYIRTRAFTHVICYSEEFKPIMQSIFKNSRIQYLCLGQPRNDIIRIDRDLSINKLAKTLSLNIDLNSKLILYCPTWRPFDKTIFFPFKDVNLDELTQFLSTNNFYLFLRAHPFYPAKYPENFKFSDRIIDLSSLYINDITEYLSSFDHLITDYSSIYIDYLLLDKKISFIPYDFSLYNSNVGFTIDYNKYTPGKKITSQKEFLEELINEDNYHSCRHKTRLYFNIKEKNCKEISDFIFKK